MMLARWNKGLITLSMIAAAGCGVNSGTSVLGPSVGANESGVTSIDIALPDRSQLRDRVSNIETLMNGYHLIVTPADSNCTDPTRVDEIGAYEARPTLSPRLIQGCSYNVILALGKQGSGERLEEVYYKNNDVLVIEASEIEGRASIEKDIRLNIQSAGRRIGLSGNSNTSPNTTPNTTPDTNTTPNVPDTNTTPNVPDTTTNTVNIPASKNFSFTDPRGGQKKLSDLFAGGKQYVMVDFSQMGCGPCRTQAQAMNSDTDLQGLLNGSKCGHATMINSSQIDQWKNWIGASTFSAQHSYGLSGSNVSSAATPFVGSFQGTPTFVVIDSNGEAVSGSIGHGIPRNVINQVCR